MNTCTRCHRLFAGPAAYATNGLVLCPGCPILAPCEAFVHDYRGSIFPGTWVCWRCGSLLESAKIQVDPVSA